MPENECPFERQFRIRPVLNRLKHARRTVVGKKISLMQQAAANWHPQVFDTVNSFSAKS